MSLPRELLDDLLSRYMDGSLSDDERRRVEQILSEDAEAQAALQALQQQASSLRSLYRSSPKLDRQFSRRVVDLAISRAFDEALPSSHPLRLAQSEPADLPAKLTKNSFPHLRKAWLGLAIAASAALFGLTLRWVSPPELSVAERVPSEQRAAIAPPQVNSAATTPKQVAAQSPASDANGMEESPAIASLQPPGKTHPSTGLSPKIPVELGNGESRELAADLEPPVSRSTSANRAKAEPTTPALALSAAGQSGALGNSLTGLQMLMVYEVEVTALGRERNVLGRIFKQTGIIQSERKNIDESLIGFLSRESIIQVEEADSKGDASQVGMLLLEGPGLKLDRLMTQLHGAQGEVSKVGFQLAFGAPILPSPSNLSDSTRSQSTLPPPPKAPRVSNDLSGPGGAEAQVSESQITAHHLTPRDGGEILTAGTTQFSPWSPRPATTSTNPSPSISEIAPPIGSNVTAQVLLIIRQQP